MDTNRHNTSAPAHTHIRALRDARLRYVAKAVALATVLYAIIYFPYSSRNIVVEQLDAYLSFVARVTGFVVGIFGDPVPVRNATLGGKFPIRVVLDCAALDIMALYAAAVFAWPTTVKRRCIGLFGGLTFVFFLNIFRLTVLHFVGIHAPQYFHTLHEEIFQVVLLLGTTGFFYVWIRRTANHHLTLTPTDPSFPPIHVR